MKDKILLRNRIVDQSLSGFDDLDPLMAEIVRNRELCVSHFLIDDLLVINYYTGVSNLPGSNIAHGVEGRREERRRATSMGR
jgi:hypothetical protein